MPWIAHVQILSLSFLNRGRVVNPLLGTLVLPDAFAKVYLQLKGASKEFKETLKLYILVYFYNIPQKQNTKHKQLARWSWDLNS